MVEMQGNLESRSRANWSERRSILEEQGEAALCQVDSILALLTIYLYNLPILRSKQSQADMNHLLRQLRSNGVSLIPSHLRS